MAFTSLGCFYLALSVGAGSMFDSATITRESNKLSSLGVTNISLTDVSFQEVANGGKRIFIPGFVNGSFNIPHLRSDVSGSASALMGDIRFGYGMFTSPELYLGCELRAIFNPLKKEHTAPFSSSIDGLNPGKYDGSVYVENTKTATPLKLDISHVTQTGRGSIHLSIKQKFSLDLLFRIGTPLSPCCTVTALIGPSFNWLSFTRKFSPIPSCENQMVLANPYPLEIGRAVVGGFTLPKLPNTGTIGGTGRPSTALVANRFFVDSALAITQSTADKIAASGDVSGTILDGKDSVSFPVPPISSAVASTIASNTYSNVITAGASVFPIDFNTQKGIGASGKVYSKEKPEVYINIPSLGGSDTQQSYVGAPGGYQTDIPANTGVVPLYPLVGGDSFVLFPSAASGIGAASGKEGYPIYVDLKELTNTNSLGNTFEFKQIEKYKKAKNAVACGLALGVDFDIALSPCLSFSLSGLTHLYVSKMFKESFKGQGLPSKYKVSLFSGMATAGLKYHFGPSARN